MISMMLDGKRIVIEDGFEEDLTDEQLVWALRREMELERYQNIRYDLFRIYRNDNGWSKSAARKTNGEWVE